ncbi:dTDP-4-dehydrorhamnose reductase [Flaviflexus equikiangi]|uniref:dTDP-4-dehydrorhamnose reductase n=1 Tax=Flaviflexus equikiangi TaxID=2758573 RepID=A0ABS2TGU8_9ACTO|nr:dTDP-4-dehydrorhamnose reductase [Flaviflexus equikiangi]MBM9433857.1 dTDP-4-dehydrorhamnose reductase [Flaviflexus equikiangi]
MRWMVVGAKGMLGTDLVSRLVEAGHDVLAMDKDEVDITNEASVDHAIDSADVVVNVAAFTAVDAAEEREADAFLVNAVGPQYLARRCKKIGARLVHISTDYVFNGSSSTPYLENGAVAPAGAYGRTKAAGEWAVQSSTDDYIIVRTAWLYGANGACFPKTMARLSEKMEKLSVVTDEVGQPTWTADLADLILRLVEATVPSGIYHGTSSGRTNWHAFTQAIMTSMGKDPAIVTETTAAAFQRPAPRPSFSVLSHNQLVAAGIEPIGNWLERWNEAAPAILADY